MENPIDAYEKFHCLFLNWSDASSRKNTQLKELEIVLRQKYGAFVHNVELDHLDLRDTEKSLLYYVEDFLRRYGRPHNLLLIFYSGGSYVHDRELFLVSHRHAEPNIQWSDYVDRRILSSPAKVLLIFDTTNLRNGHYDRMWKRTCERRDSSYIERGLEPENPLHMIAMDGSDTSILTSSLKLLAAKSPAGFTASQLHSTIRDDPQTLEGSSTFFYPSNSSEVDAMKLFPLSWPKLQRHNHHKLLDPHDEYLKGISKVPLQEDGTCEVFSMSLGVEIQEFSPSSCLVAIKRFTIRPNSRAYVRENFMREKENLVEVSKWDHDHILGMLATFETECERVSTLNLVLPYAEGGNLHEFLRIERNGSWKKHVFPISDPRLVGCLKDWRYAVYRQAIGLADALAALHDNTGKFFIHCDIKPANILIHEGIFKLADFGLSRFKDSDETSKTEWHLGTAMYSPPERDDLMGRGRDTWALGCVFLELAVMIRFAFQGVAARSYVDIFEDDRRNFSRSTGGDGSAIFHKTMGSVHEWMNRFIGMRVGLRKKIIVDGLTPVIRGLLQEDQSKRLTAAAAMSRLKDHYIMLQADPILRQNPDTSCDDNPGGPPDLPGSWPPFPSTTPSFQQNPSPILVGPQGPLLRPPPPQFPIRSSQDISKPQPDSKDLQPEVRLSSCPELPYSFPQPLSLSLDESATMEETSIFHSPEVHGRKHHLPAEESSESNKRPQSLRQWPNNFVF